MRVSHFTLAMPYQPGTIRRSGKPCCGSSGWPFMAQTSSTSSLSAMSRLQAAAEGVLVAAVEAAVGTDEGDLDGVVAQAGALQHVPQRRAGPLGVADRLADPGHARIARAHGAAAVAGALQRDGQACVPGSCGCHRARSSRALPTRPATSTCHVSSGHIGHVEMIEQVMQARRRHVVAQRLQQDAAVAVGELHFLELEGALDVRPPLGRVRRDRFGSLPLLARLESSNRTS